MNKLFFILLFFTFILLGCNGNDQPEKSASLKVVIYLYIDLTELEEVGGDFNYLKNSIENIKKLVHVNEKKEKEGWGDIYVYPIRDFSSAKPLKISLPASEGSEQNRLTRLDIIRKFERDFKSSVDSIGNIYRGNINSIGTFRQSYIVRPLIEGIKTIFSEKNTKKIIIIFSDMLENTANFSFYTLPKASMTSNYNFIKKKFENIYMLPPTKDIDFYIVYQPSKEKDELILNAKDFWERYLYEKKFNIVKYGTTL